MGIVEAAKALKKNPATLRKWIQQGAPCLEPGEVGRGHGAQVDLAALQRWRARKLMLKTSERDDGEILVLLARSFGDALRRDGAHDRVDIAEAQAAGFLALVYERCWMNLTMKPRHELVLPPEIERMCAIYVQSQKSFHGR